jgi:hypothetical protein
VIPRFLILLGLLGWAAILPAPVASAQTSGSAEVEVDVDSFGFASVSRPGDYTGIRLALRDLGDRVRPVAVRLHLEDPDGDTELLQRVVTLNPGVQQGVWLYARLPTNFSIDDVLLVTVHEVDPDAQSDRTDRIGRRLATRPISVRDSTARLIQAEDALIGMIGTSTAGLDQYSTRDEAGVPPTAHEWIRLARLDPSEIDRLPDRWLGYAPLETFVWTGGDPSNLRLETAEALRDWVYSGGRLVIVLPALGGSWFNSASNPVFDLMPDVRARRREGYNLEPLRMMLTTTERLPLPSDAIVHTFEIEPGTPTADAAPILETPGGDPIVVRRLVGAGEVTLIGIELSDRQLATRLDAELLWHRVLGKRFDVKTAQELNEMQQQGAVLNTAMRDRTTLDDDLSGQIDKTGQASVGVLLGLVVFSVYLVAAGPGGFWALSKRNWQQHAWVAFVLTTGVFTVGAWAGASAVRPSRVEIKHVSIIDHVYGQDMQRVRTWFTALLPTYGSQTITVGEPGDIARALTPWEGSSSGFVAKFPDARAYVVDAADPSSLTVPTRATVKKFQADWAGAPQGDWKMPLPLRPIGIGENGLLTGVLRHELPADLTNVIILYVAGEVDVEHLGDGGPLFSRVLAWGLGEWRAEANLDLQSLDTPSPGGAYFDSLTSQARGFTFSPDREGQADLRSFPDRLEMLSLYSMLDPPAYTQMRITPRALRRRATQTLDLGRWFTQPCVIVLGQVPDGPAALPLTVDGREVAESGRTMVRWVYPLEPAPAKPAPARN